jgi:hypothetical protein
MKEISLEGLIVGFTGSQKGMTKPQQKTVKRFLKQKPSEAHHGLCIGSDEEFHALARPRVDVICVHPCNIEEKRAKIDHWDMTQPVKPPLVRNKFMASQVEVLLATPKEDYEIRRSGTWATIRAALKLWKTVIIVLCRARSFTVK